MTNIVPHRDWPPCPRAPVCILTADHHGMHIDADGHVFTAPPDTVWCAAQCPDVIDHGPDWICVLNTGHQGHHTAQTGAQWHGTGRFTTPRPTDQ